MECKECKSGYPVTIEDGKGFCGFCGHELNPIELKILNDPGPLYSDEDLWVTLQVKLYNDGDQELDITTIEISNLQ